MYLPFALDMPFYGLALFAVFYGLDWIASVPPTVRLLSRAMGGERVGIMVAWITVIHQVGGAMAAYLGGVFGWASGPIRSFDPVGPDVHRGGPDGAVDRRRTGAPRAAAGAAAGRVGGIGVAPVRAGERSAGANRAMITASIMLATIMQGVDNTIANVALPHIQGSLSAAQDQIAWVLTSYIVAVAIMMPLTGWLAGQLRHQIRFSDLGASGSRSPSALCGSATSLDAAGDLPHRCRAFAAPALVPLSQSVLMQINPPERHGRRWRSGAWGSCSGRSWARCSAAG